MHLRNRRRLRLADLLPFKVSLLVLRVERLLALVHTPAQPVQQPPSREQRARKAAAGRGGNACCYLIECDLNDSETGEILGMSPETVRH